MRGTEKFQFLQEMKHPKVGIPLFIIANPSEEKRQPSLHRDVNDEGHYSVFFLLTDVTMENGTVRIYPETQHQYLYEKQCEDYNARSNVEQAVYLLGSKFDIFVFDGRLLHRSQMNNTCNSRLVLSFAVYDKTKYKGNYYGE